MDFTFPADHRLKLKECEKEDKYLDFARELKKTMEHESDHYVVLSSTYMQNKSQGHDK